MTSADDRKRSLTVNALLGITLIVLAIMYFTPIWWVSLKAPNYPPEAFPDGIRIHFHFNGVFNGCSLVKSDEVQVEEALNCVHEMDTINHYVGMYPIASGGPIERALSQFLVSFLGVMIIGFACRKKKLRAMIMTAGFTAIALWMYMAMYTESGVMMLSDGYRQALQSSLDLDVADIHDWSGIEAVTESYRDTLGIYFRQVDIIEDKVDVMRVWTNGIVIALIAAMVLLVVGAYLTPLFYWLLIIVPILLPVFFVIDYAAWLWYFGHNLNTMGAFAVKPFMPTVFGQGKVAQFSTHSYPHMGYFMMLGISAMLIVAGLVRKKQIQNEGD
ncbi:MAG: hypothetical protein OEY87_06330 [Gammaproteobacteria bacterium]|nr:hypothetical protein [Gammaproteobacteria bacterium]MDH5735723.1 hypothetical protein [Gammaproteobacteria bacterium]